MSGATTAKSLPPKAPGEPDAIRRHPAVSWLLPTILFAGLAAPPLMLAIHGVKDSAQAEFRRPAPFPTWSFAPDKLDRFPFRFEAWYRDAFGLRTELITAFNRASVLVLDESPADRLVIGKDKWIFHRESEAIATFRGVLPLSYGELEEWRAALEQRSAWLASKGSTFLYAPIPSKLEVYPEKVPGRFTRVGVSRRAQLLAHLAEHSDLHTLDLLPVLTAAKAGDGPERHVYFPFGVHWTDVGARAASEAVADRLRELGVPAAPARAEGEYEVVAAGKPMDSWASRLHLEGYFTETESYLEPKGGWLATEEPFEGERHRGDSYWKGSDPALPTAAVYHDSFGPWVLPFLSQSFSETFGLLHVYFEPGLFTELQPDVVIQLQTERLLVAQVPMLLAGMDDEAFAASFAASEDVRLAYSLDEPLGFLPPFEDGEVTAASGADGPELRVHVRSGASVLLSPRFDPVTEDRCLMLRLDLEAHGENMADLFFKTASDAEFASTRTYPLEVKAGRHVYYVPLSYRGMQGELGLRLGQRPGRFVLRGLEIRAVEL